MPWTFVSQISRHDDLPFIIFLFFHCVDQVRSSLSVPSPKGLLEYGVLSDDIYYIFSIDLCGYMECL